ncbi:MAG: 3-dehydroquinate synthase [Rickettsiales bacterium TMED289]|nr:MAG: 3-dehydroquinate synthase [Rickettsiales bacterium TMED289]|tara:strand:- start:844 stop:1914 length:1071 start_codon:yes stop_codon:yes gene_type:complete
MANRIKVDLGAESYNISIINNFVNSISNFSSNTDSECMLITQKNIYELYKGNFKKISKLKNLSIYFIDDGEQAKSVQTIDKITNEMASRHFDRSSIIFAVGGGVVGDIAGFVASIFMRGIDYVQYPTTLLAMIDSSIGGKTGINLESGKNLIGRIYQPKAVEIDMNFISTLPKKEINASLAEAIKYGFIYDKELFGFISSSIDIIIRDKPLKVLEKIIIQCCEIKSDVVSEDVHENELRMILNFGHTVGHAIEGYYNYDKLLHGEAIFYGMKCALFLSNKYGDLSDEDYKKSLNLLSKFDLPPINIEDDKKFMSLVKNDKKFRATNTKFILLDKIGKAYISSEISLEKIKESLSVL